MNIYCEIALAKRSSWALSLGNCWLIRRQLSLLNIFKTFIHSTNFFFFWALAFKNCEGYEILPYFQVHKFTCQGFKEAGISHETSGSMMKDFIAYSISQCQHLKGTLSLGKPMLYWTVSMLAYCCWGRHCFTLPKPFAVQNIPEKYSGTMAANTSTWKMCKNGRKPWRFPNTYSPPDTVLETKDMKIKRKNMLSCSWET